MGLNLSKRIEKTLSTSPAFTAACDSVYDHCLTQAQHAFPGVRPYQLLDASARLHSTLSDSLPLVKRWAPSPPGQAQVDSALRRAVDPEREVLDPSEFKKFAVELFRESIASEAGKVVFRRVPIGVAGIAGIGMVTRSGAEVVGRIMGVYTIGVVAAVYLSLS